MNQREKELIEMLLKQAGYKKDGLMYVNNDLKSAFAVNEIFPKVDHLPLSRHWINIQDKLPEPNQKVDLWLVFKDKKPVRISWTWEKQDNENTTIEEGKITHWMPFLEPPQTVNP